jgi:hypothetical protein
VARYKLGNGPLFERLKQREQLAKMPSVVAVRRYAGRIILLACVFSFMQMDGYVSGTYIISFMGLAGIPLTQTATLLLIARFAGVCGLSFSGPCANVLGRRGWRLWQCY